MQTVGPCVLGERTPRSLSGCRDLAPALVLPGVLSTVCTRTLDPIHLPWAFVFQFPAISITTVLNTPENTPLENRARVSVGESEDEHC